MPESSDEIDLALERLRSWIGLPVVVRLDPEGTVMAGALSELDPAGIDGALFALDGDQLSGVAIALFRDGVRSTVLQDDRLVIDQGRMTVTVTRAS